jgi:signal transduction histidine kinase
VDLVEVLKRAAVVAEPEAHRRNVRLMLQAPGRLRVMADGSLIRRALENLMLNAIEFAGQSPPGQVTAALLPRAREVLLIVEDDGPGVPADERDRIFQAYYSSKSGGTGLGLALVKQVMEAHGGTIASEASPLGGARFVASLPLKPVGESAQS